MIKKKLAAASICVAFSHSIQRDREDDGEYEMIAKILDETKNMSTIVLFVGVRLIYNITLYNPIVYLHNRAYYIIILIIFSPRFIFQITLFNYKCIHKMQIIHIYKYIYIYIYIYIYPIHNIVYLFFILHNLFNIIFIKQQMILLDFS